MQSKGLSRSSPTRRSKAPILQCSPFFIVQLSHSYMTTGKTIALTRWTFVDKVMSLLFNTLSTFVKAFLPRIKHFLISWLQLPSAVIWGPKKIVCHCFPLFSDQILYPLNSWYLITLASLQQVSCQVGLARLLLTLDVSLFL